MHNLNCFRKFSTTKLRQRTTELNRLDGVMMVKINPDLSTESRTSSARFLPGQSIKSIIDNIIKNSDWRPELSEPIKLAINEHSQPNILPRLLGSVLEEEFDYLPGLVRDQFAAQDPENNASLKGYPFPKAGFLKNNSMNSDNSINHSTIMTKGTTLGTCLVRMSTSGKIESALAAYQGNGVIEYCSEVLRPAPAQLMVQGNNNHNRFASNPSTSQAGPSSNSKSHLKTFNKEPTGRVDSGEQEAVPGVEVQDDCTSPLSSLEIGSFSNSSLKPLQLPTRSNQFSLRVVYHQT
ncbi:hypothetical protein PPACK8108_LOCUS25583 [Phakopsora pachyrhizi]|uniref:Uncharacterized protein n=1 Tax=Phakopsora pachyrhizi TaxID=170000 RepID=A0AAV0BSA0_PHAPC|nr:hypothetical protein PPACK8108_LOCUS25583 [Phakopsora pachyrhizi]